MKSLMLSHLYYFLHIIDDISMINNGIYYNLNLLVINSKNSQNLGVNMGISFDIAKI